MREGRILYLQPLVLRTQKAVVAKPSLIKMSIMRSFFLAILPLLLVCSCHSPKENAGAVPVKILRTGDGFQLYRDGKPYFIKGARTLGTPYMDLVASIGGNSVRIGGTGDVKSTLDTAQKYGLTVLFGLPFGSERNGFDYNDVPSVISQYDRVMKIVNTYKNHPAILMWAIGNEMDFVPDHPAYNLKLWDAVNDVAHAIHVADPAHPVITVTGTGRKDKMADIVRLLPDIDALGINSYADIGEIPVWTKKYHLDKPYIITEWGPDGHWQVHSNKWGLPVEETSTEKARDYDRRYKEVLAGDPRCLGGYSFLWTQGRQERTHTWYNMFYDNGEPTGAVDVMQHLWSGSWPRNRAPEIDSLNLNGMADTCDILLLPGSSNTAAVTAHDPENGVIGYEWEIYPENTGFGYAGQGEKRPAPMDTLIPDRHKRSIIFSAPGKEGDYRLFVYVRDQGQKIALANILFHTGPPDQK